MDGNQNHCFILRYLLQMNDLKSCKNPKGYIFVLPMLTHGLLAIEMLVKFTKLTSTEISFKSSILLLLNVKVVRLVGRKRSHCLR